jgi:hypothetical protein
MDWLLFFLSPLILWISTLESAVNAVSEPEKKEEHTIKRANPIKYRNMLIMFNLTLMISYFGGVPQGTALAGFDYRLCV